ncbi:DUF3140 domain-containing protein [Halopseudomonas nanhaiensis]|uniref:DUF3140 domain-containing protein n=1 Tax=Halopseudomonas nanhaiensis TaxID=2830842 RepID=UPI001CBD7B43|nr:DUF3140 domain-containing protein [Halopseudomonas nanhaiensis]UAW99588.1 DUF3140 domain-containing protein [Halopseudomonas nanhaiensis]
MASDKSRDDIWQEWKALVNMAPAELERWLETDESKSVGDADSGESTGHKSGKRIVEIKRTNKDDLTDDQWAHMAKVVGYINRHLAQGGPDKDVKTSAWRYSLMNWGHDPLKS